MISRELLAVEFNPAALKLAHVTQSGSHKKEVLSLGMITLGGLSEADIAKALATSYSAMKVKTLQCSDVIPASVAITKNIEVPSTNPQEIREIINLQAGRHTPYSREEIIVDYVDIGVYKRNYTKILLVIVARNVIKKHTEILSKAGLSLQRVVFAPEAVVHFVSRIARAEAGNAPTCILHFDDAATDFTVTFKNKLLFVRSIPIGANQFLSEREKVYPKLIEELKKSLEAYQSQDIDRGVCAIALIGAAQEWGIESILHEALQLPVKAIGYTSLINLHARARETAAQNKAPSYLNVVASLVACEEIKVDLVPEEIKLKKALQQRAHEFVKAGIYVLSCMVTLLLLLMSTIYFKSSYARYLKEKYGSIGKEAQELQEDYAKVQLIKNYLAQRGVPLEVLAEVYALLPLEIELNDVRFDGGGKFSIKGTGESMSIVFALVDDMEKSKVFKEAKTKYTTKRKEGKRDVVDFEIACLLESEGRNSGVR